MKLIEELQGKGSSTLSMIVPLLDSQNEDLRYQAARAILAINSDPILSKKALRSILNSQKFRELMLEPKINGIATVVDALLHDSSANLSSLERRNLLRLLRVLLGPEAVITEQIEDGGKSESAEGVKDM